MASKQITTLQRVVFDNLLTKQQSTCFMLKPSQIQILDDPYQFYLASDQFYHQTQKRMGISSLFFYNNEPLNVML
jgi:hypothetical protein